MGQWNSVILTRSIRVNHNPNKLYLLLSSPLVVVAVVHDSILCRKNGSIRDNTRNSFTKIEQQYVGAQWTEYEYQERKTYETKTGSL